MPAYASTSLADTLPVAFDAPVELFDLEAVTIPGTSTWCFLVDDGEADPVVSVERVRERGTEIAVARTTLAGAGDSALPWTVVTDRDEALAAWVDAGGDDKADGVADHWHCYAHGLHWFALSVSHGTDGIGVALVAFSRDFGVGHKCLIVYAQGDAVGDDVRLPDGTGFDDNGASTNDLCMVETSTGVAILLWAHQGAEDPDVYVVVHIKEEGGALVRSLSAFPAATDAPSGRGNIPLANGASLRYLPDDFPPYVLLAPETLQPGAASRVYRVPLRLDDGWMLDPVERVPAASSAITVGDAMCTEVDMGGGYLARAWRRLPGVLAGGESGGSGAGDIYLEIVPPAGEPVAWLVARDANRPHLAFVSGVLVIGIDSVSHGCQLLYARPQLPGPPLVAEHPFGLGSTLLGVDRETRVPLSVDERLWRWAFDPRRFQWRWPWPMP